MIRGKGARVKRSGIPGNLENLDPVEGYESTRNLVMSSSLSREHFQQRMYHLEYHCILPALAVQFNCGRG